MVYYVVAPPVSAGGTEDAREDTGGVRRPGRGSALTERQRLERICEWRRMVRACRGTDGEQVDGPGDSVDEASAEREVGALRAGALDRAVAAEAEFWSHLVGMAFPEDTTFEPFVSSKTFSAEECVRYPLQEAARRWFRALTEMNEIDDEILRPPRRRRPWRSTLAKVRRVQARLRSADLAWEQYVALYREAQSPAGARRLGPDAPVDYLAAWAAAQIGNAHLAPLLARAGSTTRAGRLSEELTREIWIVALTHRPGSLPVPAFSALPGAVARGVREMYTHDADKVDRLQPAARRRLGDMRRPEPDPLAALLSAEEGAIVRGHLAALPPGQRRAVELRAQGFSRLEIAAAMGCGEESVKKQLSRADRRLRSELGAGGEEPAADGERR